MFFPYNAPPTTEIYTLSLHDALPISTVSYNSSTNTLTLDPTGTLSASTTYTIRLKGGTGGIADLAGNVLAQEDRKSTRLNSSHLVISYAVFCLKKKKTKHRHIIALTQ